MTKIFWSLAVALVACRFYEFRPYLDHPHLFRQADTAFYSLGFYRFGMNILTPSVGWLGDHRHLILEFPLTEWVAAGLYLFTGPTILVDRLVNLGFFLGSAFFLFRVVELVHDRLLARIVVLLYMAAPLGIYYSRAVHIDFTAVCFSHAMLYHTLRFIVRGGSRSALLAVAAGTLAFVIKAPYVFYLLCPALFACYRHRAGARAWMQVVLIFAAPVVAFAVWFAYMQSVNRLAPDLSFIPSYFSHVDRFTWYFGTLAERGTIEPWQTVIGRVFREIAVTVWWAAVPIGLLARERLKGYYGFALAWSTGTVVYLLIFLKLNEMHNYYQIPFIAPFSLWLGGAVYACWTSDARKFRWGRGLAVGLLVAYAASSMFVATRRFYWTDPVHLAIGEFVRSQTFESDLVVMAYTKAEYGDPSFLFYARRYGWSVGHQELSRAIVEALATRGATAIVTSTLWSPDEATRSYLRARPLVSALRIGGGDVFVHRIGEPRERP